MNDFIFNKNSQIGVVVILAFILLAFVKVYTDLLIKLRKTRTKEANNNQLNTEDKQSIGTNNIKDTSSVVNNNFILLERYYNQALTEYKLNTRVSILVSISAFIIILIGVVLAYLGFTSVGIVSASGGIVGQVVGVLFYRQNTKLAEQVENFMENLISTQYLFTSISLAENLSQTEKEAQIKLIINNLLYLSNNLLGFETEHLKQS